MHEILHILVSELKLGRLITKDSEEELVGLLGLGLSDTFVRNGWLQIDDKEE